MHYFLKRLKEPSSWAGLAALAVLFGVPAETANVVVQAVGAVAGAAAVLIPSPNEK